MKSTGTTPSSSKTAQDKKLSSTTPATTSPARTDAPCGSRSEFSFEVTKKTKPKEIREFIAKLETVIEERKKRMRDDLAAQVNSLLTENEYTVEELLGARTLPSTSDLAKQAKHNADLTKERANKMADSTFVS